MIFLLNGPDIPEEIIQKQRKGKLLFLCGAGISQGCGLPGFKGLVELLYKRLDHKYEEHFVENDAIQNGQYDQALFSFEQRLIQKNINNRKIFRDSLSDIITGPYPQDSISLEHHKLILNLSTDSKGKERVITTNFDTLFERSMPALKSHAGSGIPSPGTTAFNGIIHLHGRVKDQKLNIPESDIVLTSSEFGDAYLKSGWASRYVYNLVRAYTVILIGYSANDPPIRYLLNVLQTDREIYKDLNPVYAFVGIKPEDNRQNEYLRWEAKGVKPIFYKSSGDDHSVLYNSLKEWCHFKEDIYGWIKRKLDCFFKNTPPAKETSEYKELLFLLLEPLIPGVLSEHFKNLDTFSTAADMILYKKELTDDWIIFLIEEILLKNKNGWDPVRFITNNLDNNLIIYYCNPAGYFDNIYQNNHKQIDLNYYLSKRGNYNYNESFYFFRSAVIHNNKITSEQRKHWELFINQYQKIYFDNDISSPFNIDQTIGNFRKKQFSIYDLDPIINILKPQIILSQKHQHDQGRYEIVYFSKKYEIINADTILKNFPEDFEWENILLKNLCSALENTLEEARYYNISENVLYFDSDCLLYEDICPYDLQNHFVSLVYVIYRLWIRISFKNPEASRNFALCWSKKHHFIYQSLYLSTLRNNIFTIDEIFNVIKQTHNTLFLNSKLRNINIELLIKRWKEFSPKQRLIIEKKIRSIKNATFLKSQSACLACYDILKHLHHYQCILTQQSLNLITKLSKNIPRSPVDIELIDNTDTNSYLSTLTSDQRRQTINKILSKPISDINPLEFSKICKQFPSDIFFCLSNSPNLIELNDYWACFLNAIQHNESFDEVKKIFLLIRNDTSKSTDFLFPLFFKYFLNFKSLEKCKIADTLILDVLNKIIKYYFEPPVSVQNAKKSLKNDINFYINQPSYILLNYLITFTFKKKKYVRKNFLLLTRILQSGNNNVPEAFLAFGHNVNALYEIDSKWTMDYLKRIFEPNPKNNLVTPSCHFILWGFSNTKYRDHVEIIKFLYEPIINFLKHSTSSEFERALFYKLFYIIYCSYTKQIEDYSLDTALVKNLLKDSASAQNYFLRAMYEIMLQKSPPENDLFWTGFIKPVFTKLLLHNTIVNPSNSCSFFQIICKLNKMFPEAVELFSNYLCEDNRINIYLQQLIPFSSQFPRHTLILLDKVINIIIQDQFNLYKQLIANCLNVDPSLEDTDEYKHLKKNLECLSRFNSDR